MVSRRSWLSLGSLGLGAALITATGLAGWQHTAHRWHLFRQSGQLAPGSLDVLDKAGLVLLDGLLPADHASRALAMQQQLARIAGMVTAFPVPVQHELHLLLQLLDSAAGRRALARLHEPWQTAAPAAIAASLQQMRVSSWTVRQQAYQALRDLHFAAWTAQPSHWQALGYPGPSSP